MDTDPIFLAPQDYSITWPILGAFIIFGLLIWCTVIWMLTRRPDPADEGGTMPPAALLKLRRDALGRIDAIDKDVRSGKVPARRGHHALSKVVRGFVSKASGIKAETMTASDLRERGPAHLAALIEEFYPQQFGAVEADSKSFPASAQAARDVVGGWG